MCLIKRNFHLLVTGGGDGFIILWNLQDCRVLTKFNLMEQIRNEIHSSPLPGFAISQILYDERTSMLFICVERQNCVWLIHVDVEQHQLTLSEQIHFDHPVLFLAIDEEYRHCYIAIDNTVWLSRWTIKEDHIVQEKNFHINVHSNCNIQNTTQPLLTDSLYNSLSKEYLQHRVQERRDKKNTNVK